MSKEKVGFRDNLERIDAFFPDKELLSATDIARYEGCHRTTAAKKYRFNASKRITKADYARQVSV